MDAKAYQCSRMRKEEFMGTAERLDSVYRNAKRLSCQNHSKIVVMSDCHRGAGNWGDNFLPNENLFFAALFYYYRKQFTYIELGDGDELWENRNLQQIVQVHSGVFWLMAQFYRENKLYMIFGNHDREKDCRGFLKRNCERYYCESNGEYQPLFPCMEVLEGLILEAPDNQWNAFLTHGHQGDFINDAAWRFGRFLVRYLWRPLELLGLNDPTSTAKNYKKKRRIEQRLEEWAEKRQQVLITGHTHRPVCTEGRWYYNAGSCVHPRCITALEIEGQKITLVKWSIMTRSDGTLYVGREELEKQPLTAPN